MSLESPSSSPLVSLSESDIRVSQLVSKIGGRCVHAAHRDDFSPAKRADLHELVHIARNNRVLATLKPAMFALALTVKPDGEQTVSQSVDRWDELGVSVCFILEFETDPNENFRGAAGESDTAFARVLPLHSVRKWLPNASADGLRRNDLIIVDTQEHVPIDALIAPVNVMTIPGAAPDDSVFRLTHACVFEDDARTKQNIVQEFDRSTFLRLHKDVAHFAATSDSNAEAPGEQSIPAADERKRSSAAISGVAQRDKVQRRAEPATPTPMPLSEPMVIMRSAPDNAVAHSSLVNDRVAAPVSRNVESTNAVKAAADAAAAAAKAAATFAAKVKNASALMKEIRDDLKARESGVERLQAEARALEMEYARLADDIGRDEAETVEMRRQLEEWKEKLSRFAV